jgi:hypothetical protein
LFYHPADRSCPSSVRSQLSRPCLFPSRSSISLQALSITAAPNHASALAAAALRRTSITADDEQFPAARVAQTPILLPRLCRPMATACPSPYIPAARSLPTLPQLSLPGRVLSQLSGSCFPQPSQTSKSPCRPVPLPDGKGQRRRHQPEPHVRLTVWALDQSDPHPPFHGYWHSNPSNISSTTYHVQYHNLEVYIALIASA